MGKRLKMCAEGVARIVSKESTVSTGQSLLFVSVKGAKW